MRLFPLRMLVAVGLAAVLLAGCDWSAIGFGPANTNFDPGEPALTQSSVSHLAVAWSTPCACGEPLISGGVLYVADAPAGSRPTLRAFDAATGASKWARRLHAGDVSATVAAVANGLVYAAVHRSTKSDQLAAFDAATGKRRWALTPPAPAAGQVHVATPVVDGTLAFVAATASDATELSAVDPDGHVVWSAVPGGVATDDTPLAANPGHTIFVATFTPGPLQLLTGYNESDGAPVSQASVPLTEQPIVSIAYSGGLVFGTFDTAFGRLGSQGAFAMQPDTGVIRWSTDLFELAVAPASVITSQPRATTVTARDPETGNVQWTVGSTTALTAFIAGDLVITSSSDTVTIRRLGDGATVGTIQPAAGETMVTTVPANGYIYASSVQHLYALTPS